VRGSKRKGVVVPYTIDTLPKAKRGGTGRKKIYDFTPYLDGSVHVFTRGSKEEVKNGEKDYSSKDVSFGQLIRTAADAAGLVATVIVVEDGVAMQTEPLTEEVTKARAERAAKRKATMEANAAGNIVEDFETEENLDGNGLVDEGEEGDEEEW